MTDVDVSRVPQNVNIDLYAGDGVGIRFTVVDSNGNPYPLDGVITSQIKAKRLDIAPLESWTVDNSQLAQGIVTISLTGAQTTALLAGQKKFKGVWDLQYVPTGGEPLTLIQGKVTVDADVTH